MNIFDKAEMAMQEAIQKVIEQHQQLGMPLAVWRNGKVQRIFVKKQKDPAINPRTKQKMKP